MARSGTHRLDDALVEHLLDFHLVARVDVQRLLVHCIHGLQPAGKCAWVRGSGLGQVKGQGVLTDGFHRPTAQSIDRFLPKAHSHQGTYHRRAMVVGPTAPSSAASL